MIGTNGKRVLLVSSSVILLCVAIILGMTWSLFTDTRTVLNHIKAGDLSITLKRTELVKTTLNISGYLVDSEKDTSVVDFSGPTRENVFSLATGNDGEITERIVPGSKFVATMQIENHSDVAFGYWIQIKCDDEDAGKELGNQLRITVNVGDNADGESDFVGTGLEVRGDDGFVDVLAVNESGTFKVTVEFLDDAEHIGLDNDAAQNDEIAFDLIVHAVQATDAPTAS